MGKKSKVNNDFSFVLFQTSDVIAKRVRKGAKEQEVIVDGDVQTFTAEGFIDLMNVRFSLAARFAYPNKKGVYRCIVGEKLMKSKKFGNLVNKMVKILRKSGEMERLVAKTTAEIEFINLINDIEEEL
jgi:hypothetical protein